VASSLTGPYSDDEIEAALDALSQPDRLAGAQDLVARFAPQLQRMLAEETRLAMFVGVAVGVELARELARHPNPTMED
jgi:hypothetical protein